MLEISFTILLFAAYLVGKLIFPELINIYEFRNELREKAMSKGHLYSAIYRVSKYIIFVFCVSLMMAFFFSLSLAFIMAIFSALIDYKKLLFFVLLLPALIIVADEFLIGKFKDSDKAYN